MLMVRFFLILLTGVLLALPLNAQKSILLVDGTISDGLNDATPIYSIEETETGIIVTYEFQWLNLLPDPLFPSAMMPRINGFGFSHTLGTPEVPMRLDAISLPLNTIGHVSVIDSTFVDVPLELSPARGIRDSGDEEYTALNVLPVSSYRGYFPSNVVPSVEQHSYRGNPVINVCVCPVKYNSESKTTRIYSRIKYLVTWTENRSSSIIPSSEKFHSNADFLNKLTLNTINTQGTREQGALTTEDYLIVSTQQYSPAVERLAEWKRMLGFRVEVLYQNGWSANSIKAYIQHFDSLHSNFNYVLFLGGHNEVKSFKYGSSPYYLSDNSYSCINGAWNDIPEIYRGRLLASSLAEAEILVDKIINYERNPIQLDSFYNTGINGAVFECATGGYEGTRAVLTSELVRTVVVDSLQKDINFVYLKTGEPDPPAHWNPILSFGNEVPESVLQGINWNGTASKMLDYIDEGAFYTLFIGHGVWNEWKSLSLTNNDLDDLENGNKLPVVFSMSCYTGNFYNNDCFAQHFCSLERKGCIAMFAPTKNTQQGVTEIVGMNMFDAIWPNSQFWKGYPLVNFPNIPTPSPTFRLGQILNQSVYKTKMTWNPYDPTPSLIFHCFGDPSMRIYTEQPTSFDNATINRSGNTITVNAGESNAEISFYNKTTGEVLRYNGLQYAYNCGTDDVSVCISGPNKIPYVDPLFLQDEVVTGPVEYDGGTIKAGYSVTDTKTYGNVTFQSGNITIKGNNIVLDAGTTVELGTTLSIENW